jgi:hypothetical protein
MCVLHCVTNEPLTLSVQCIIYECYGDDLTILIAIDYRRSMRPVTGIKTVAAASKATNEVSRISHVSQLSWPRYPSQSSLVH